MHFKYLVLTLVFSSCSYNTLRQVAQMPDDLRESSGLTTTDGMTVWTHNDSGGEPSIYEFDLKTKRILRTVKLIDAKNKDWEDMTRDRKGNMYIGDFGNNNQKRKDLCIYKTPPITPKDTAAIRCEKIRFTFADQKEFPPNIKYKNFDCESFVHYGQHLYLFSKNHTKPYNGYTKIYRLSDQPGTHVAVPIDSFKTGTRKLFSWITSATISPDQKKLVLLTSDKIFVFSDFEEDRFFRGKHKVIPLYNFSQKEAIAFIDHERLLISDEKTLKVLGGRIYTIKIH